MRYSAEVAERLMSEYERVRRELDDLYIAILNAAESLNNQRAKDYLMAGAMRRVGLLGHCLDKVYQHFPPTAVVALRRDALLDAQVNLQAFVLNLYGTFENLAWAFVVRHDLEVAVGGQRGVGMFQKKTQRLLPAPLQAYLRSSTMVDWHDQYLKLYRDALAHRIPLYIPPSAMTAEEGDQFKALEELKPKLIVGQEWERLDAVNDEQSRLGRACPTFLLSLRSSESTRPVALHSQMLCDASTVLEFAALFLKHWHSHSAPQ